MDFGERETKSQYNRRKSIHCDSFTIHSFIDGWMNEWMTVARGTATGLSAGTERDALFGQDKFGLWTDGTDDRGRVEWGWMAK